MTHILWHSFFDTHPSFHPSYHCRLWLGPTACHATGNDPSIQCQPRRCKNRSAAENDGGGWGAGTRGIGYSKRCWYVNRYMHPVNNDPLCDTPQCHDTSNNQHTISLLATTHLIHTTTFKNKFHMSDSRRWTHNQCDHAKYLTRNNIMLNILIIPFIRWTHHRCDHDTYLTRNNIMLNILIISFIKMNSSLVRPWHISDP